MTYRAAVLRLICLSLTTVDHLPVGQLVCLGKMTQSNCIMKAKTIVITGSTKGVAGGLTDAFLGHSYQVMLNGRFLPHTPLFNFS